MGRRFKIFRSYYGVHESVCHTNEITQDSNEQRKYVYNFYLLSQINLFTAAVAPLQYWTLLQTYQTPDELVPRTGVLMRRSPGADRLVFGKIGENAKEVVYPDGLSIPVWRYDNNEFSLGTAFRANLREGDIVSIHEEDGVVVSIDRWESNGEAEVQLTIENYTRTFQARDIIVEEKTIRRWQGRELFLPEERLTITYPQRLR